MEQQELPQNFNSTNENSLKLNAAMAMLRTSGCPYIIDNPLTGERHLHGRVMVDVAAPPWTVPCEVIVNDLRGGKFVPIYRDTVMSLEYGIQVPVPVPDHFSPRAKESFRASVGAYARRTFIGDDVTSRSSKDKNTVYLCRNRKVA